MNFNNIKTMSAFEMAIESLKNRDAEFDIDAVHKKYLELKIYSGMLIGSGYDFDGDYYYVLLMDESIDMCIIYNENDYYRLMDELNNFDDKLPVTITGGGVIIQGKTKRRFNTSLNTEYEEQD